MALTRVKWQFWVNTHKVGGRMSAFVSWGMFAQFHHFDLLPFVIFDNRLFLSHSQLLSLCSHLKKKKTVYFSSSSVKRSFGRWFTLSRCCLSHLYELHVLRYAWDGITSNESGMHSTLFFILLLFWHQSEYLLRGASWLEAEMQMKSMSSKIWLYPVRMNLPSCNIMSIILRCVVGCLLIVGGGNRSVSERILG